MRFVDPRGERSGPITPYDGCSALAAGEQIALFANGFPGSVEFLTHIGSAVERLVPGLKVKLWNKGNASARVAAGSGRDFRHLLRRHCRIRALRQLHIRHGA